MSNVGVYLINTLDIALDGVDIALVVGLDITVLGFVGIALTGGSIVVFSRDELDNRHGWRYGRVGWWT